MTLPGMLPVTNVYAHLPEVPPEGQYRLGGALYTQNDDLWLNTMLDDGTYIVAGEPEGWEGIEFITPLDQVGGRDGALVGPPSVGPRTLAVTGAMVAPNATVLRSRIRDLRARLGPRKFVAWEQYDFGVGERLAMVCVPSGDFRATPVMGSQRGGVATTFSFTLIAANPPWKYSAGNADTLCVGLASGTQPGRTYSKTYDWSYGGIVATGGVMYPNNRGDIDAWPVYEFTGPTDTSAIVTNESTGEAFTIISPIPSGQTVTIDSRTGIVTPSNYFLVGRPFSLTPGVNTVRWRVASGNYSADANMCLTWRNTWE